MSKLNGSPRKRRRRSYEVTPTFPLMSLQVFRSADHGGMYCWQIWCGNIAWAISATASKAKKRCMTFKRVIFDILRPDPSRWADARPSQLAGWLEQEITRARAGT